MPYVNIKITREGASAEQKAARLPALMTVPMIVFILPTLFMIVLGKYSVLRSVVVGVAVNALFFVMFEVWFKVPLYKGEWHPLSFLGY